MFNNLYHDNIILYVGAKVEFGEMSYTVDEGTNFVSLELVRYSDSMDELVISLTLRDGTARGEGERKGEREGGGGEVEVERERERVDCGKQL